MTNNDNVLRLNPAQPSDHIRMMQMPDMWPLNRVLALTRTVQVTENLEAGVILATERELGLMVSIDGAPRWTVFVTNMFDRRVHEALTGNTPAPLIGLEQIDYDGPEGILADGWRVD